MSSQTTNKPALLTVKLPPSRLEEFRISAMLRGTTMSALVHQFIASVVREEMTAVPQAFRRRVETGTDMIDLLHGENTN